MSALPKRYFTPEEYNTLEAKAEYRSQYVAGEIFAMAGAQPWHGKVMNNLGGMLYNRFRGRPCEYFVADMRVRVKSSELWTYPDVAALCGEPKFDQSKRPYSLLNPQVIFEVLSPSTEQFDRGDKFTRYQQIESLSEYVLVSAERMQIEHYVKRTDGSWTFHRYDQPTDVLALTSVDTTLPLAEIYERVQFPEDGDAGE